MNKLLKNKTAVFLGTSYMVFKCMILSKNVFKKIYFISDKKSLKKKIKYVQFINFSSLKKLRVDYLFSILNERLIQKNILANVDKLALNFHNGPLPRYSGLNSSSWSIINKEKKHGCCWHEIQNDIDTGDIISKENFSISSSMSAYQIDATSSLIGIKLFENILNKIKSNKKIIKRKQNLKKRTYFGKKKLKKFPNLGFLNFDDTYEKNNRIFRSLNFKDKKKNYILKTKILINNETFFVKNLNKEKNISSLKFKAGQIIEVRKSSLVIKVKDSIIKVDLTKNVKKTKNMKLTPVKKINFNEISKIRK